MPLAPAPPGGRRRISDLADRFGWGFADQAVSSLSNFLLGFLVARSVDAAAFGAFSVAYATYLVTVGIVRGAVAQPLVVRYTDVDDSVWRQGTARAGGFALVVGLAIGLGCLAIGLALGGSVGWGLVIVAVIMPGLLVQDMWRYALFARGRGREAAVNDGFWLALQIPALGLALLGGGDVAATALLAWGAAGAVAALYGARQTGIRIQPGEAGTWFREHRRLIPRYVLEAMASLSSSQIVLFGVGAMAGLVTLGVLRVGQLLIGPVLVVFIGLQLVAVPQAVRALGVSIDRLRRLCLTAGLAMAGLAAAWGLFIAILPDGLGQAMLGANWELGQQIVIPLALGLATASFSSGALIGLRAFAAATRSLRSTVISSTLSVIATITGAVWLGASGAAWGIVLAHTLVMPLWWWEFEREAAVHRVASAGGGPVRSGPR